jgi:hypothetical protein
MSRKMPQGNLRMRFAAAERRLQTDDAIARLRRAAECLPDFGHDFFQPRGQIRLGEELLRFEIGSRSVVLANGPDIGGEYRFIEPPLANIAMRQGDGMPGGSMEGYLRAL